MIKNYMKKFSKKEKYKELYSLRTVDFNDMKELIFRIVCIKNIHILNAFFKVYSEKTGFLMKENLKKKKKFIKNILAIPVIFLVFLLISILEGDFAENSLIKFLIFLTVFSFWGLYEVFFCYYNAGKSTLINSLKIDDDKRKMTINIIKDIVFYGEKEQILKKLDKNKASTEIKKRRI